MLTDFVEQPDLPTALREFIHQQNHPNSDRAAPADDSFNGPIRVFHSASIQFYAPSDLCGPGGMYRETIRANPVYYGSPRFDTVFVSVSDDKEAMNGLLVARVRLLFSYYDPLQRKDIPCALISWFTHPNDIPQRDEDTGMWKLCPEHNESNDYPVQVIHVDAILRSAHLLPCFGKGFLPVGLKQSDALDAWDEYLVNHFIDYHTHELLS